MQPAVARKFLETFSDAVSVQLFVQTEIVYTGDELDVINVDEFYERYKRWPPRVRMSGAKFIEVLKVTCRLDVTDYDPDEPTLIVGAQLKATGTALVKAKRRNTKKPPPSLEAVRRAAKY